MATAPATMLLHEVRRLAVDRQTDREPLGRFAQDSDERAFAELLRRHGPMVWAACRRILPHAQAEDAFQATFLLLANKAAALRGGSLGGWLYGVAHRVAMRARSAEARRLAREALA